ncbi:MAG: malate dehydrogenase [Promethearchaeota archaeon]|nr:MAG: malate dehydrogenase [Candidatus Lokiarchaeota archaeon]
MQIIENKTDYVYIAEETLREFLEAVFIKLQVPQQDARIITDVLITADLKGIDTHGIQRLLIYYDRIKKGIYNPITKIDEIKNTPTTAVLDGNYGMGHVIAYKAMNLAIQKAKKYGLGAVAVRNSTHFGIAGYYSQMAIKEGCIGITTTNATPAVPPTNGIEPMLGTNPLTAGVPTDEDFPFLLDCATSIIQKGKIELYSRNNKDIPEGVVLNEHGLSETDPNKILDQLREKKVALLPIGANGTNPSGYKGYGYSTLVEILSSALQEGVFLKDTEGVIENGKKRLKVGHFFLAINIENFISIDRFKTISGTILRTLRSSKKLPGKKQIYTAGEKEHGTQVKRKKLGIPINKSIQSDIIKIKNELHLNHFKFPF